MAQFTQHHPSVRNSLLAALSPRDWARLEPHLEAVELPFDQTIHAAGGPIDAAFFVETGMVSMIVTLEDEDQIEAGIAWSAAGMRCWGRPRRSPKRWLFATQ
jgi:hypothetical protein